MEKNLIIMGIFVVLGIVGILVFQTSILGSGFVAGAGYLLAVFSVIIGVIAGIILK